LGGALGSGDDAVRPEHHPAADPAEGRLVSRRPGGITNRQASMLASLQMQLGEEYTGAGMTRAEASRAIEDCLRRLGRELKPKGVRTGKMFRSRGLDRRIRRERTPKGYYHAPHTPRRAPPPEGAAAGASNRESGSGEKGRGTR
jgi:hypothetical protein